MCLYIDPVKHPSMIPVPIQLERDLVVFKVLEKRRFGWVTPWMNMQIHFKHDKYECKYIIPWDFDNTSGLLKQDNAYHSYININAALSHSDGKHRVIFMAVIPKKSYVFYGNCGEICSNDLTIYKKKIKL